MDKVYIIRLNAESNISQEEKTESGFYGFYGIKRVYSTRKKAEKANRSIFGVVETFEPAPEGETVFYPELKEFWKEWPTGCSRIHATIILKETIK